MHLHGHGREHDGMGHHDGEGGGPPGRRLFIALGLTTGFMFVEVLAGFWAHSLALLSDAGHMLADAGALALALAAEKVASRPRSLSRTYGYRRAETLAALANGVVLIFTAAAVIAEAFGRWRSPSPVAAGPMLGVAVTGLMFNLVAAWVLSGGRRPRAGARGDAREVNANVRAAAAHVASDALGSGAAVVAGALMLAFGWTRADAVAAFIISLLILFGAYRIVSETVNVLMESVPSGVVLAELEETIRATPGVAELHDLHAWTISDGFDAITVHVVLDGSAHGTDVARDVGERIRDRHRVAHVTVQPEAPLLSPVLHRAEDLLKKRGA